jgi:hypothetical protein
MKTTWGLAFGSFPQRYELPNAAAVDRRTSFFIFGLCGCAQRLDHGNSNRIDRGRSIVPVRRIIVPENCEHQMLVA